MCKDVWQWLSVASVTAKSQSLVNDHWFDRGSLFAGVVFHYLDAVVIIRIEMVHNVSVETLRCLQRWQRGRVGI
jgi:hypothetical protein